MSWRGEEGEGETTCLTGSVLLDEDSIFDAFEDILCLVGGSNLSGSSMTCGI